MSTAGQVSLNRNQFWGNTAQGDNAGKGGAVYVSGGGKLQVYVSEYE